MFQEGEFHNTLPELPIHGAMLPEDAACGALT